MNNILDLANTLTASGGAESAGFLNDIIQQLWPNVNVAGCKMVKEIVEPILASTLPGPLANLRFTKLDLGHTPLQLSAVDVHKTSTGGIKLDMDVNWESESDIELDGKMVPKIGIERVNLKGRLSILLAPLTNVIPLIGAIQVAFINPPELSLDFTDAANIADLCIISGTIRKIILGIIGSMAVLPNRFIVKLDNANDYFKTYQPHLGIIRLTIEQAFGIKSPGMSGAKCLLARLVQDVPDCYCKLRVGAEKEWRTSTKNNDKDPKWNESHDFLVADFEQIIFLDVQDDDFGADDDIGIGSISIKDILLSGGTKEIALTHKGKHTGACVKVHAQFFNFVSEPQTLSVQQNQYEGRICGLANLLVASVLGLQGQRNELQPSVKVSWGENKFRTAVKTYIPGVDIFNPSFDQAFAFPITREMIQNPAPFRFILLDKEVEVGVIEIPYADVQHRPDLTVAGTYDVGGGVTVRIAICLKGLQSAQ